MKLVFLYGLPATGKLTVAQKLATLTGYKLFHNHLVVDLLLSVFDFGTEPFVRLREEIWLSVFEQAGRSQLPGLIFTFAPERTVRPTFPDRAVSVVNATGGEVHFIELTCPVEELRTRLDNPSRLQYHKLTSHSLFDRLHAEGVFDSSKMPMPQLTIDTSLCTPEQAATRLAEILKPGL
jgi:chloramphenicol 3-O-phosphotransferase